MGKQRRNRALRAADKDVIAQAEGELRVSFVFDGQVHVRTHQMNAGEIQHMKDLCRDHGDAAAEQLIWRQAVRNSGWFAENVLAVAGQAYVLKHHRPVVPQQTVFDKGAQTMQDIYPNMEIVPDVGTASTEPQLSTTHKIDPASGKFIRKFIDAEQS